MTQDVMAPVVQGTLNAFALANQLRRTAMEQEQVKLAQAREARAAQAEEREARYQEIERRLLLGKAGRRVRGGVVGEMLTPPRIGNMPEELAQPYTVYRKPLAGETVKHKLLSGETEEYELFSQEEQFERELLQRVATARAMEEAGRIEVPGYGEVDPKVIPFLSRRADIASQEARAGARDKAAMERTREGIASREKVAGMPARKSLGVSEEQQRFDERERKRIEGEIAALDQKLETAHAEAQRLGEVSKTKVGEKFLDEKDTEVEMNFLYQARYAQRAREAETKTEALRKERDRLARSIGWRETTGEAEPAPAAGPAGAAAAGAAGPRVPAGAPTAVNPQTGQRVYWDGTQWQPAQ